MLSKPHMTPLEAFTERLRSALGSSEAVPSFDPLDGGCEARVLFLLEAPGRKARDSGFISRNNPDPTAKNMLQLLDEAGVPRRDTILWNIVPWYLGDSTRIRAAQKSDVEEGLGFLQDLLGLLPNLEEIVLVGRNAQRIEDWLHDHAQLRVSKTFHPSNRVFARWPEKRMDIHDAFKGVASRLASRST